MKKLTKVLSILLAVALVCAGLILAVSANEASSETASYTVNGEAVTGTLVEALNAADENSTVKLEGDCTLEETFTVAKSLTVDLNGYTLTAKADAFVIGANDVNFKIEGTGSVVLAGKLVSAEKDYTGFTVDVAGDDKTEGISVTHSSSNITSTYHGTWTFKNLKVVSTSVLLQGDAYFKTVRDNTATATLNFNKVSFDSTAVAYQKSTGNFVVSIAGMASVNVNNSAFRTQNSGIYAGHTMNDGPLSGEINVKNSMISCLADNTLSGRTYVVLGMDHLFTSADTDGDGTKDDGVDYDQDGFNGMMLIENSVVECNTRLFCFGTKDAPSLYIVDSTMRIAGNSGTDKAYTFVRGAGETSISGNCRWISCETKLSNVPNGTRTNLASVIGLTSDQSLVYDPVGDPDAPFIVVSAEDSAASPDFYRNYGFDSIKLHLDTNGNRDININNTNQSWITSDLKWTKDPYWFTDKTKGMQWDNKYGTITHILNEESSYVKYWIQDDGTGSSTVKLSTSDSTDTYFVMGLGSNGDYVNSNLHPTAMTGENRKSVTVAEFDFTTEEGGIGYPYMQVTPQARNSNNGGENHAKSFTINNAGNIVDASRLQDQPDTLPALNPAGVWNRLSMVCYSDPANAQYRVYIYLNGEFMGYDTLTDEENEGDYVYFQGIRLSFANNSQKVNANLLIDNVSIRAYTDYKFEGEKDSDYDEATGTYANNGVYYPEKYICGSPASQYVKPDLTVNGIAFDDVNEAVKYANSIDSVVDIYRDMNVTITENGIINTNGNDVTISNDSYGYVSDGNFVEFNAAYQYEAWFYTGTLEALENGTYTDADFEKRVVKVGDYVDKDFIYTEGASKDFVNKTISGGQNGWAYDHADTTSVLPKTAVLSDLEVADENNVIRYYPIMGAISMTYYVTDSTGAAYAGDISDAQALADFQALKGGDTFVLQGDINISEANTLFANTTDTTEQVINIDLNGYTLSLSEEGALVRVGSYTTLNVYSSVAGGQVNCVTNNGTTVKGNYAFVIDDPTVTSFTTPDLANNVKSAKINVGTIESLGTKGENMTIVAEVAFQGRVGDDDCCIVSDGVDIYVPTKTVDDAVVDEKLFNGEIYVKNTLVLMVTKTHVVNISAFYTTSSKPTDENDELTGRVSGFENTIMTGYVEFENCIFVNNLSGMGDDANDNLVSNNGDGGKTRKNILFKNVVATGRLNPSNASRSALEGFVAIEKMDVNSGNNAYLNDTAKANVAYSRGMTWDIIDLGVETLDGIHAFAISYYDTESGRMVELAEYKIANYGIELEEANAYTLPKLTGAVDYKSNFATVYYKDIAGESNVATQTYIKGGEFALKSDVEVPEVKGTVITISHTGTWTDVPEYVTEDVTLTPVYKVDYTITGIKANLSLYADFGVNIYIPADYMDVVTIAEGYKLTDAAINEIAYKQINVTQACNKITDNITVTLVISETLLGEEYVGTKVITYSAAKYAESALASETLSDTEKILVYYMINYANEAAKYINGAADEKLAAMLEANKTLADMNPHELTYDSAVSTNALAPVFKEATLTLDPKPAYVFTVKDGFVGTVTIANGVNVRTYNFNETTDRAIVIDSMKAYNFVTTLVITAEGTVNGEAVSITDGTYNLTTFAKYHADNAETNADSAACLPLVEAFRIYADNAYFYKNGIWAN